MRTAAIVLILAVLAGLAYFGLRKPSAPAALPPVADETTVRETTEGDAFGCAGFDPDKLFEG